MLESIYTELLLKQYSDFLKEIILTPEQSNNLNVSNCSVFSQIKRDPFSQTYYTFDTSINERSNTVIITLSMSAANTANITTPYRYLFDVLLKNNEAVDRVAEGIVDVTPGITIII